jgi:maleylacetoacetate isomerase
MADTDTQPSAKKQKTSETTSVAVATTKLTPLLHSYWRSSCSWRVRIALEMKEIAFDYNAVHLLKDGGEQLKATFANPKHEVPMLEIDGLTLYQSTAIIEYLDDAYPATHRMVRGAAGDVDDAAGKVACRIICQLIASGIQPVQNLALLKYVMAKETTAEAKQTAKMEWGKYWISQGFDALEAHLVKTRGADDVYCIGNVVTAADACLVPQLYNARRFKCDESRWPTCVAIDAKLAELPQFVKAHPDQQPDAQKP